MDRPMTRPAYVNALLQLLMSIPPLEPLVRVQGTRDEMVEVISRLGLAEFAEFHQNHPLDMEAVRIRYTGFPVEFDSPLTFA